MMREEYSPVGEARIGHLIDPEQLRDLDHDDECPAPKCSLWRKHEGPHLDTHHISGRVFRTWGDGQDDILSEDDVSKEALEVVNKINRLRDEALEAIDEACRYQLEAQSQYAHIPKEQDPILHGLLRSRDIWPTEHEMTFSGTENSHEKAIREELIDMFGNYERDEW